MTASETEPAPARPRPAVAWPAVLLPVGLMVVVLTGFSQGYGYHRDELYFRMLDLRWGYVDQPPLTPVLAHLFRSLADQPWAIRIPATLAAAGSALVLVLITREVGGGRAAQRLCAWGYCFAALPLIFGHTLLTSTIDLPVWPLVLLFVLRAQLRAEPRWWPAAGAVVGASLYNKLLIAVLLVALLLGLLVTGPRKVLRSRWILAAVGVMVLVGLPNLIYQLANGLPQLSMGRALSDHHGGQSRVFMWPFLLLMLGPPLVPIWLAGLVRLWRTPSLRFLAAAFPFLLLLVFAMGAQFYYPVGLVAVLFAVGCRPTADWYRRSRARRGWLIAGLSLNAAVSLVLALPLIPVSVVGSTPIPGINQAARDTVGWPTYVAEVRSVYDGLLATDRARTQLVASNYGEAGALARYGAGLPPVFSGQNGLYSQGRPTTPIVIVVGGQVRRVTPWFGSCQVQGRLDNGHDVDNEEQDEPIAVCRNPLGGWPAVWPHFKHLD